LLFSIYALRDDANQKVLEVIKDGIVDLHSCLEKEEINLLSDNYPALMEDFILFKLPYCWMTKNEEELLFDSLIEKVNTKIVEEEIDCRVLSLTDLSDNYLNCDIDAQSLPKKKGIGRKIITEDCLVMSFWGGIVYVGRVHGVTTENPLVLGFCVHAFRMRETEKTYSLTGNEISSNRKVSSIITEDYLLRSLVEAKSQLTELPQVRLIPFLGSILLSPTAFDAIIKVRCSVPNLTEQFKRYKADVVDTLKAADLRIQKAYDEYRKDVRMKKHAIVQTVFNLKNWWGNLNLARQKGNGVVSDADTIGVTRKIAVAEIYQNLDITMSKLSTQLDKFDSGYGLSREEFALPTFLEQYIAENRSPDFTFEYNANAYRWNNEGETNDTNVDKQPSITFSKEALTRVLDNIVNNARTHGFQGRLNEQNKIKLVIQAQGTDYILIVANNGAPLKDDFKKEDVFVYGQTSGDTQKHFGIGGYEIKRLMNEFEGDVELVANSESEYSVAYKLIFHNTHLIND
jgi:ATPase/histidine kinase/DNA gyrase B/HSP90 domain protein